jgi:hypothetical protein
MKRVDVAIRISARKSKSPRAPKAALNRALAWAQCAQASFSRSNPTSVRCSPLRRRALTPRATAMRRSRCSGRMFGRAYLSLSSTPYPQAPRGQIDRTWRQSHTVAGADAHVPFPETGDARPTAVGPVGGRNSHARDGGDSSDHCGVRPGMDRWASSCDGLNFDLRWIIALVTMSAALLLTGPAKSRLGHLESRKGPPQGNLGMLRPNLQRAKQTGRRSAASPCTRR